MGYFGDIHLSNSLPSPELLPMENIQAVHQELGKAFEHNTATAESLEQQLNKTKLRDNKQWYAKKLAKETTEAINTVRDNPFEMPYANKMIRNLANEKYINNQELHEHIRDKQNENDYYAELNNLRKGQTMIDEGENDNTNNSSKSKASGSGKYKKTERYPSDIIDKSILITKSRNQKEAIYDPETGMLKNSFSGYTPVPPIDISEKLMKNVHLVKDYYDAGYLNNLQETNVDSFLREVETQTLPREKAETLASVILREDPHYNDFLKQKALFEKVDNTPRDENGLLIFKENGDFDDINMPIRAWNNPEFISFLKEEFETEDKSGNKILKNEKIGLIGSDEKSFYDFMTTEQGNNLYYEWFKSNEKNKLIKEMGDVFNFKRYSSKLHANQEYLAILRQNLKDASDLKATNVENFNALHYNNIDTIGKLQQLANNATAQKDKEYYNNVINNTILKDLFGNNNDSKNFRDDVYKAIYYNKDAMKIFKQGAIGTKKNRGFITAHPHYKNEYKKNKNTMEEEAAYEKAANDTFNRIYNPTLFNFENGYSEWWSSVKSLVSTTNRQRVENTSSLIVTNDKNIQMKAADTFRKILEIDAVRKGYNTALAKNNIRNSAEIKTSTITYNYNSKAYEDGKAYINIYNKIGKDNDQEWVTPEGAEVKSVLRGFARDKKLIYYDNDIEKEITLNQVDDIQYNFLGQITNSVIDDRAFGNYDLKYNGKSVGIKKDEKKNAAQYQMLLSIANKDESVRVAFNTHMQFAENNENNLEERINSFNAAISVATGGIDALHSLYHANDFTNIYEQGIEYTIKHPISGNNIVVKKYDIPIVDASGNVKGFAIKDDKKYNEKDPMPINVYKTKVYLETMLEMAKKYNDRSLLKYLHIAEELDIF